MVDLKFNLKSWQRLETQMKALLNTLHSKDWKDINQAGLIRLNKVCVANFVINASKLLKSTHGLLRSAAAHLDCLKCEQFQSQSKLI